MLPPIHNTRSPQQWQIISREIGDWEGRGVIDLGCGYADILARCLAAGAEPVWGVESNRKIAREAISRLFITEYAMDKVGSAYIVTTGILEKDWGPQPKGWSIGICFSVLPYLIGRDRLRVLKWMAKHCDTSLIEVQYVGDGPGNRWEIKDDTDMMHYLHKFFGYADIIGYTDVKDRGVRRTIWRCQ